MRACYPLKALDLPVAYVFLLLEQALAEHVRDLQASLPSIVSYYLFVFFV